MPARAPEENLGRCFHLRSFRSDVSVSPGVLYNPCEAHPIRLRGGRSRASCPR